MNLFLRLLWLAVFGRFRSRVPPLGPCETTFRVLPTDLDLLRHMNNGVYLSLMDVGRVDLMRRAGLLPQLFRNGWYPIVLAETIQFRRSLKLFEKFKIVTRVLAWDDRGMLLEQVFERRGETIARGLIRGRFLSRKGGSVPISDIMALAGVPADHPQPALDAATARWNADYSAWVS